jgi:hypothetical protein
VEFANLVGKTIASAEQKQHPSYDDDGFLELTFTDGSKCLIVATYCGYSGHSEDEYPTSIFISQYPTLDDMINKRLSEEDCNDQTKDSKHEA